MAERAWLVRRIGSIVVLNGDGHSSSARRKPDERSKFLISASSKSFDAKMGTVRRSREIPGYPWLLLAAVHLNLK